MIERALFIKGVGTPIFIITFSLSIGLLYVFVPWYFVAITLFYFMIVLITAVRLEWGLFLLIILVPIDSRCANFIITSDWNFLVGSDKQINRIPMVFPAILSFFFVFVIYKLSRIKEVFPKDPLHISLWVLASYALLSLFWAPVIEHSLFQLSFLLSNIFLYVLCINIIDDQKTHYRVMWVWVLYGAFLGVISFGFYFVDPFWFRFPLLKEFTFNIFIPGGSLTEDGLIKRGSALTTPHETALIMNLVLCVAVGLLMIEKTRIKKICLSIIIFLCMATAHMTMTRGAFGALLVEVFFLLLALKKLRDFFFSCSFFFIAGIIALYVMEWYIVATYVVEDYLPRFIGKAQGMEGKIPIPTRMEIWTVGFKGLKDSSLLGVGVGNFKYHATAPHAHSIPFSFLFDFGLIGLGVFASWVWVGLSRLLRLGSLFHQDSYPGIMSVALCGGCVALGIHGLVDFEYNKPILWLFLGMTMATFNLAGNSGHMENYE